MMDHAEVYARKWRLKEFSHEGETTRSNFYSCRSEEFGPALLKILNSNGLITERGGFALLARYNSNSAVRIYEYDETAALMQWLDGPRLLDFIDQGHEEDALNIQLEITRQLLKSQVSLTGLKTLEHLMADSLNMKPKAVPVWAHDVVPIAQAIAHDVMADRSDWQALHGDLHPRNIIKHGTTWRAIDARSLLGPPALEYANLFINPWDRKELIFRHGRMEDLAKRVSMQLGCDIKEVVSCAITNALYYAQSSFLIGQGRHPIKCIRQLLTLL